MSWRRYVQQPNPVAAALMSRMHIESKERPLVKLACLRLLAQLGLETEKSELVSQFFDTYLPLDPKEEEQFNAEFIHTPPEEQTAMLELTTSWERKGREEERQLREQAERERDAESQRAEQERQRAEQERQRAEQERQRADRLAAKLRELGLDPEA